MTFHRQIYPEPGWEEARGVPLPKRPALWEFPPGLPGPALAAPG